MEWIVSVVFGAMSLLLVFQPCSSVSFYCERHREQESNGTVIRFHCITEQSLIAYKNVTLYRSNFEAIGHCHPRFCLPQCTLLCETENKHGDHLHVEGCENSCLAFSVKEPLLDTDYAEYYISIESSVKVLAFKLTKPLVEDPLNTITSTSERVSSLNYSSVPMVHVSSILIYSETTKLVRDGMQSTTSVPPEEKSHSQQGTCPTHSSADLEKKYITRKTSFNEVVKVIIPILLVSLLCIIGTGLYILARKRTRIERVNHNLQNIPIAPTRSTTSEAIDMAPRTSQPLPTSLERVNTRIGTEYHSVHHQPPAMDDCTLYEESAPSCNVVANTRVNRPHFGHGNRQGTSAVIGIATPGAESGGFELENMYLTVDDCKHTESTSVTATGHNIPTPTIEDVSVDCSTADDEMPSMLYAKPEKRRKAQDHKSNRNMSFRISAEVEDSDYDVLQYNFQINSLNITVPGGNPTAPPIAGGNVSNESLPGIQDIRASPDSKNKNDTDDLRLIAAESGESSKAMSSGTPDSYRYSYPGDFSIPRSGYNNRADLNQPTLFLPVTRDADEHGSFNLAASEREPAKPIGRDPGQDYLDYEILKPLSLE